MKQPYQWLILGAGVLSLTISNSLGFVSSPDPSFSQKMWLVLVTLVGIASHFFCVYGIARLMQKKYQARTQVEQRVIWSFMLSVPLVFVLMIGWDAALMAIRELKEGFNWIIINGHVFQTIVVAIFVISLSEAFYQYQRLRQVESEKEELLRINLLAQYDSLKQQLNPHFLFNTLNSLSSLIAVNPVQAERFVEEMGSVYRYLLQNSQEELTTLGQELSFTNSYLHLQKTRFGESLDVIMNIPEEFQRFMIPPFTLQLLAENAVKHNVVSNLQPLRLSFIITKDQRLKVTNNLQPKVVTVPSPKVGLANIMARYRLLQEREVEVCENGQEFTVTLPLIAKKEMILNLNT